MTPSHEALVHPEVGVSGGEVSGKSTVSGPTSGTVLESGRKTESGPTSGTLLESDGETASGTTSGALLEVSVQVLEESGDETASGPESRSKTALEKLGPPQAALRNRRRIVGFIVSSWCLG